MTTGADKGEGPVRRMPLPRRPESAGVARQWLRELMHEWCLPQLEDDCLLVTTELVVNAVLHGTDPIRMQVELHPDRLLVIISDARHAFATPAGAERHSAPGAGGLEENGRGLQIVQLLTDCFHVDFHDDDGKSVIAEWRRPVPV